MTAPEVVQAYVAGVTLGGLAAWGLTIVCGGDAADDRQATHLRDAAAPSILAPDSPAFCGAELPDIATAALAATLEALHGLDTLADPLRTCPAIIRAPPEALPALAGLNEPPYLSNIMTAIRRKWRETASLRNGQLHLAGWPAQCGRYAWNERAHDIAQRGLHGTCGDLPRAPLWTQVPAAPPPAGMETACCICYDAYASQDALPSHENPAPCRAGNWNCPHAVCSECDQNSERNGDRCPICRAPRVRFITRRLP